MGGPKALLEWNGKTFLESLLDTYQQAGVTRKIVVTFPDIVHTLRERVSTDWLEDITWVWSHPEDESFVSLLRGMSASKQFPPSAFFLGPVDQGPVPLELLESLLKDFDPDSQSVRIPRVRGENGHPVLLGSGFVSKLYQVSEDDSILSKGYPGGLRAFIHEHCSAINEMDVPFSAVLRNLNYRSEYEAFLQHPNPINEAISDV